MTTIKAAVEEALGKGFEVTVEQSHDELNNVDLITVYAIFTQTGHKAGMAFESHTITQEHITQVIRSIKRGFERYNIITE